MVVQTGEAVPKGAALGTSPVEPRLRLTTGKDSNMLATIGIILIVLWLLGLLVFKSLGAIVHIALVVGIILIVLNFMRGRRAV